MDKFDALAIADNIVEYLSSQTFQNEPILHAVICCDFVSRQRMINKLADIILKGD